MTSTTASAPLAALRQHVTGRVLAGTAQPIVGIPAHTVTVADPADPTGSPAYDGTVADAAAALEVGTYPATFHNAETGRDWPGELVVVTATFAHFALA